MIETFSLLRAICRFIDVDDTTLGALDVKVSRLQKAREDVFHIVAHIAGFGESCGVSDGEGDLQDAGGVWARYVLPLPVSPMRRMLLFAARLR